MKHKEARDWFESMLFDYLDAYSNSIGANGVDYDEFKSSVDKWKSSGSFYVPSIYGDAT